MEGENGRVRTELDERRVWTELGRGRVGLEETGPVSGDRMDCSELSEPIRKVIKQAKIKFSA